MSNLALAELPANAEGQEELPTAAEWETIMAGLVTEDDKPVDNLVSAKQQRLSVESLYSSWTPPPDENAPEQPRRFLADANVAIYSSVNTPAIVPDVFVSLDVTVEPDWRQRKNRSYFTWEHGKPPEVVMEIVSNKVGHELSDKMRRYARMFVNYYVVFDPLCELSHDPVGIYELENIFGHWRYRLRPDFNLPAVGLGLQLWRGTFEGIEYDWLRWCDAAGNILLTGKERADAEAQRANKEAQRADTEAQRANKEAQRADTEAQRADAEAQRNAVLIAKLRELGVDPAQL